jgi:two-component system sensor histidine kinase BaeS
VLVNGKLVARVQLIKLHRASEQLDDKFLRSQYFAVAGVSGIAFLIALGGVLLFSRRLVAPLRSAQTATAQIAHGDFRVRLAERGSDEVADLVRNINAMAGSLQTLGHARRNWLAQLSHELRTPLTVLQGECEAMMDGVRPVNAASVAGLHDRILALRRIVEDLHLVSLADLGVLPHTFAEADAVELVRHVLAGGQARLTHHGLDLAFASAAETISVQWDAGRIQQLLENLIENTIRYTDSPGRLEVHLVADPTSVTLRWEDSAPGVSPGAMARLFEPLYQADARRSQESGGSGLGLAICRAIVHAHLGTIAAEASPLGGVCIVVTLPRYPTAHDSRS